MEDNNPQFTEKNTVQESKKKSFLDIIAEKRFLNHKHPFPESREFIYYNEGYEKIVPQVMLPNCQLPDKPSPQEKKAIKHYYNSAGVGIICHILGTNIIAFIIMFIIQISLGIVNERYLQYSPNYMVSSSLNMSLNLLTFFIVNVGAFFVGCKATKIPISSFFRTKGFKKSDIYLYCAFGLCINIFTGILYTIIKSLLPNGNSLYEATFESEGNLKIFVIATIYTCLVAPITEELLYRGFIMKNLSRVSQRFGIFASAFIFGVAHENLAQGILAFFAGIFLGYITMKHDSLIPAIIVHVAINSYSSVCELLRYIGGNTLANIGNLLIILLAFVGGVIELVNMICNREKLPKPTKAQKKRSLPLASTSVFLVIGVALHLLSAIYISSQ